jgi:hypothetical protein
MLKAQPPHIVAANPRSLMVVQSFDTDFLLRRNHCNRHKTQSGVQLRLGGTFVAPVRVHSRQTASSNLRCLQAMESLADLEPD